MDAHDGYGRSPAGLTRTESYERDGHPRDRDRGDRDSYRERRRSPGMSCLCVQSKNRYYTSKPIER